MNIPSLENHKHLISFKWALIYLLVTFLLFLSVFIDANRNDLAELIIEIFAIFGTIILGVVVAYYYINRTRYLSLSLMFAFVFSLIIGFPSVYLYFFKGANNGFEIVCVWGIYINSILYLLADTKPKKHEWRQVNNLFYVVLLIVSVCQFYKIYVYFNFIISSGAGHLAIYTESEELLSRVPFFIRAVSGFSLTMALAAFYFKSPQLIKLIAFLVVASDLAIGIRNKFFFSAICMFILYLYSNEHRVRKIFKKLSRPLYIVVGFVAFSLVSYYREAYQVAFLDYFGIVLDSLSSTLAGMQYIFDMPSDSGWSSMDASIVFSQVLPLSGLGFISDQQIAHEFSILALGDISSGIALSSSGLLESSILCPALGGMIYTLYLLFMIAILNKGLNSKYALINFIVIAMLPGFLYSVRGELVLPIALLLKSLPIIMISPLLIRR